MREEIVQTSGKMWRGICNVEREKTRIQAKRTEKAERKERRVENGRVDPLSLDRKSVV